MVLRASFAFDPGEAAFETPRGQGFREVVDSSRLECLNGHGNGGERAYSNHPQIAVGREEVGNQLQSISTAVGQLEVEEKDVKIMVGELRERGRTVVLGLAFMPHLVKVGSGRSTEIGTIV